MRIEKISFEVIKPFWEEHLWPGRKSPVEPVACINSNGEIDLSVRQFTPLFYGAFESSSLVGVISFSLTSSSEARLRGICVHPDYRDRGISKLLFYEGQKETVAVPGVERLWLMSRLINLEYYAKLGFVLGKETNAYEFGPHNIMFLNLKKDFSA